MPLKLTDRDSGREVYLVSTMHYNPASILRVVQATRAHAPAGAKDLGQDGGQLLIFLGRHLGQVVHHCERGGGDA